MERFVIGAAIFAAVVIAAGGYFGHAVSDSDGFRFEINTDEDGGGGQGTGAAATAAAQSYAGTELKIRNAVALVKIIPEDRTDISVEVSNSGRLAMPTVKVEGAEVIVDGVSPNTVCLPSRCGVGRWVMKNWLPFVAGPEFAMEKMPALSCLSVGTNSSANL